jgi:CrcB protein
MIYNILLVAAGGAIGSILRYLVSRLLNFTFPYGTMVANIAGCLIIGLLWGLFTRHADEQRRLLLVTGFCGGFTTFSTFSYESIQMLMQNRISSFILYTSLSITACLFATYFGYKMTN